MAINLKTIKQMDPNNGHRKYFHYVGNSIDVRVFSCLQENICYFSCMHILNATCFICIFAKKKKHYTVIHAIINVNMCISSWAFQSTGILNKYNFLLLLRLLLPLLVNIFHDFGVIFPCMRIKATHF